MPLLEAALHDWNRILNSGTVGLITKIFGNPLPIFGSRLSINFNFFAKFMNKTPHKFSIIQARSAHSLFEWKKSTLF